ncbi:MAG: ATP-binding protein [Acidimicrobiales bacterium]
MNHAKSFAYDRESVTRARHFASSSLGALPISMIEPIMLMVSELATNAFRHARTDFEVAITSGDSEVRVEVSDRGPGEVQIKEPNSRELSGRGLRIVDALSDSWGVLASSGSGWTKSVWFTLHIGVPSS